MVWVLRCGHFRSRDRDQGIYMVGIRNLGNRNLPYVITDVVFNGEGYPESSLYRAIFAFYGGVFY